MSPGRQTPQRLRRRRRRRNEEAARGFPTGFESDDPDVRRREGGRANPRVSSWEGYLLGRWWPGENGEEIAGNEDLAGRYGWRIAGDAERRRGCEAVADNVDG